MSKRTDRATLDQLSCRTGNHALHQPCETKSHPDVDAQGREPPQSSWANRYFSSSNSTQKPAEKRPKQLLRSDESHHLNKAVQTFSQPADDDDPIKREVLRVEQMWMKQLEEVNEINIREVRAMRQDHARSIETLQRSLASAREDYASLHIQLQHHDNLEPLQVRDEFVAIQNLIADSCRGLIQDFFDPTPGSIVDISNPEQLKVMEWGPPISLLESAPGVGRDLDDFLECSLLVIINTAIQQSIYDPFHPIMSADHSNMLLGMYDKIRFNDPQVACGQWRVHTFKALEQAPQPAVEEFYSKLIRSIEKSWLDLVNLVYGAYVERATFTSANNQLEYIVKQAYHWNRVVKSNAIKLDFHPRIADHDALFDNSAMHLGKRRIKPEHIICTLAPGLESSEAQGGQRPPRYKWQEKIGVQF